MRNSHIWGGGVGMGGDKVGKGRGINDENSVFMTTSFDWEIFCDPKYKGI